MEAKGNKKSEEAKPEEGEGFGLLGEVHYEDIGNGKLRCLETGHELPSKNAQSYGNSKGCRLALIDRAVAEKKPPLNLFEQSPIAKGKLICKLTGDIINKTEQHIWKHLSGRKFQNRLAEKEAEKERPRKVGKKIENGSEPKKIRIKMNKHSNVELGRNDATPSADADPKSDSEGSDFWTPPVGSRWDDDDGKDRWEGLTDSETKQKNGIEKMADDVSTNDEEECSSGDIGAQDVTVRTKRMSIAVGPSSFAPRKKKSRLKHESTKIEGQPSSEK